MEGGGGGGDGGIGVSGNTAKKPGGTSLANESEMPPHPPPLFSR